MERITDERLEGLEADFLYGGITTKSEAANNDIAVALRELCGRREADWVSVSERLPEDGVPVLIVYAGVVQHETYQLDDGIWSLYHDDDECMDDYHSSLVTHWRPLPAPPES